ncbi:MAG TPA: methyltransferase domain-containing protein [Trebonia sp.]|nr:methyltransferase domain-containing protein [Trebonia sp.]
MSHDTTARTGAPARDAAGVYALGADTDETARLRRQSEELQPEARALLARLGELGLRPGQAALDLGCGPRGILDLLAEAVGPGGRVVGLDADPAHVTAARQFAFSQGLANVEVLAGDARHTGLPAESFDLVHTRTLLVTIPEPAEVVAEMARLARPGGLVASQEADAEFSICYPPLPEWDRLLALFRASFPRTGADLRLGRQLPELFREAGLTDVGATVYAGSYPAGHSRRTVIPDLVRSLHPVIIGLGLAGERELADVDAAVRAHLADPRTLVMPHLLVTAWGRKP